jgi:probable phosphoglycerate mutase
MTDIYIARHGQDEDNVQGILNGHRDTPLTPNGKEQANVIANTLLTAGIHFDKVYTSPLQRAYSTAEIITTTLHLPPPTIMDSLIERDF